MKTITTQELKQMLDRSEDVALINVLSSDHFRKAHIPESENIPVGQDDFTRMVEQSVGGKDRKVVVYCASTECDASPKAAKKLEESGFTKLYDYEGGTKAWQEAGYPIVEGGVK